jgi:6-phosphogluconate dehydrogenase
MQIGVIGLGCMGVSLFVRFRSRQEHMFAEKVLSAMRFGFGGHVEPPAPTS